MTDEEAFVRAVVDGAGDDLPRLAYADWLDDRSDPHGPYLRTELSAVGRITRRVRKAAMLQLRELTTALDPLWVARVTRPPLGVCCDHVKFNERGPVVSLDDVTRWNPSLHLPADYVGFLLNYNGGWPEPCEVRPPTGYWWKVEWFTELRHLRYQPPFDIYPGSLSVADTNHVEKPVGTFVLIPDTSGNWRVDVGYTDYRDGRTEDFRAELSPSFSQLLSMIR